MRNIDDFLAEMGWREILVDPGRDMALFYPTFVHEFGDRTHHMSMVRTCDFDEDGSPIRGTGPSDRRYRVHELLDDWVFYLIDDLLRVWLEDHRLYRALRLIIGFFWGLNCGFPFRDVVLYTLWDLRGSHAERITMQQYRRLCQWHKKSENHSPFQERSRSEDFIMPMALKASPHVIFLETASTHRAKPVVEADEAESLPSAAGASPVQMVAIFRHCYYLRVVE